ncbi:NrfD/PsrC family molybdoenzyme membrane anchor subunit [Kineosporia sp. A_224]|uniref:NrfD/PsrC family molybdoenzyme membrane anchor subunit n=1 Tax=Kineosporia sp. A_224 TaxID=1962180 RepID=UPI000B4B3707|nr:NrfD/PsrC family molybdoenzyme membrane anchor subunit [Kineosporia sp. A_224]
MSAAVAPAPLQAEQPDVVEAVMRPFRRPSNRFRLAVVVLSLVVLLGVAAWVYQLSQGMAVAGYTDRSFWAIYIADVVSFIGVSYGGAVVSAILMLAGASWRAPLVRLAEGVALVSVVVGAAFIIPHLGRPDRLLGMVTHANVASPVFWDMVAILTYTVATVVFFVLPLVPDTAALLESHPDELGRLRRSLYRFVSRGWTGTAHQRRVLHSAMTVVAIVIIPLAVSVHSVLAWAFALVSRPGWHESIWAPYFVIAALYSGVALVILVVAGFRRGYRLQAFITEQHFVRLAYLMLVLGAVYVYLTFADLLPSAYVGEAGPSQIVDGMLEGPVAVSFWLFVVVGTVLPIVLVALPWTRNIPGITVAALLVLVAMWTKRVTMVVETSAYDRLTNSFGHLFGFTWVSVSVTLGGVAAVALLLMLLFRLVPVLAVTEIQELDDEAPATGRAAPERTAPERTAPERTAPERTGGRAAGRAGAVLLVVLAVGAAGSAKAEPAYAATKVPTVAVTATEDGPTNTVSATVTLDGRPVKGALVNFAESTTMFAPGDNMVPLGSVETDAAGTAQVVYVAAVAGPRTVTATYFPTALGDPVVASTTLDVTDATSPYRPPAPHLLAAAGRVLASALFATVLVVLLILAAQVVRVRRASAAVTDRPVREAPRA